MTSIRKWLVRSVIAALILLSPVVAFLMVISAELLIDGLMETGLGGACIVIAGAIGWSLFRSISRHRAIIPQPGIEPISDDGAIAVPPI